MEKTIEEKFKALDERTHILERPGMYIGSINNEIGFKYILNDENKFVKKSVTYNPGFIKLFDEIISNSVDESRRIGTKLDTIKVDIDMANGEISIWDNGGIPVEIHKTEKMYIPEMVFSKMRAGSNFNDDDSRTGVGTNGVGSSCVNVFSKKFSVETADGKNKFIQVFQNNMSVKSKPKVESTKKHYTKITYIPDFIRFGMNCINNDTFKCIESRVYEVAGTNPNLNIYFQGNQIKIKSFKDYCELFI